MKIFKLNRAMKYVIGFLLLSSFASVCLAGVMSPSHRAGTWEMFLGSRYVDKVDLDFKGGAEATINDNLGFSWGFGYNFNEKMALSFDAGWDSMGYNGKRVLEDGSKENISGTLNNSRVNFSGTYYFMATRLTPYVNGAFGWSFVDTNIATGPPQGGCWWDPWFGYICSSYQPTKTSTLFTYGAELGLRFDVTKGMFFKGSVGQTWSGNSEANGTPSSTIGRLLVGFKF